MGWEIKDNSFFCNTVDEYFGPYLDESIWPNMDDSYSVPEAKRFYEEFYQFLEDNPVKSRYGGTTSDPREFTDKELEKLIAKWEKHWLNQ
jgi:hypothetical protein